jgi:hypothetical protein
MNALARSVAVFTVLGGITLAVPMSPAEVIPVVAVPAAPHAPAPLPGNWRSRMLPHVESLLPPLDRPAVEAMLSAVDQSSRRFRLDPVVVLGVIQVESRFDPFAVSPKGAMGLMQLRVDTARPLAEELGVVLTADEDLFEIETNILLGACYLRELLDRFGNLDDALAAFHAGPSFVEARRQESLPVSLAYPDRVWDAIVILKRGALA